jgi:hypothetical protein
MGAAFLLRPDRMVPDLTETGRAATRVLGCALLGLAHATHGASTSDPRAARRANLLFHLAAGCVLGWDVATKRNGGRQSSSSPFLPPTVLHVVLTTLLVLTYGPPPGASTTTTTTTTAKAGATAAKKEE